MQFTLATIAAAAALFSFANAHVEMIDPPPFESQFNKLVSNPKFDLNSPLGGNSGLSFPCGGRQASGSVASYAPGEHTIKLRGGAVHGGGSCQVSLAFGNDDFRVITSLEAGCPSGAFAGNAADAQQEYTIPFTIPADAKAGEATLSWSWFNKIGNREMYMNCATITIEGSGTSTLGDRPSIFKANVPGVDCATVEGVDTIFPSPGNVVVNGGGNPGAPVGAGCGSSSGGSTPPPAFTVSVPGQNLVGTKTEITTPTTLAKVTTAPPAVITTPAPAPEQPAATTTAAAAPIPTGSTGDNSSTTDCAAGVVICQPDGLTWKMCGDIQGNTFQVPPGTVCKDGAFDFAKRDLSHEHSRRTHLRRRNGRKHL